MGPRSFEACREEARKILKSTRGRYQFSPVFLRRAIHLYDPHLYDRKHLLYKRLQAQQLRQTKLKEEIVHISKLIEETKKDIRKEEKHLLKAEDEIYYRLTT